MMHSGRGRGPGGVPNSRNSPHSAPVFNTTLLSTLRTHTSANELLNYSSPCQGIFKVLPNACLPHSEKLRDLFTEGKFDKLVKQRLAYGARSAVLRRANATVDDLPAKVEALLDGVNSWSSSGSAPDTIGGELSLADIRTWLPQVREDSNFSTQVLQSWAHTLETHVRHMFVKFEFTKLFGKLFTEWVASGDFATAT
ncbi:hypothetical protein BD779DRAFT_1475005 [Infundibulicybe gibba]|nr:hypothetical protein BD779DRAFT_1475005 [Infundibulicybe gibba]